MDCLNLAYRGAAVVVVLAFVDSFLSSLVVVLETVGTRRDAAVLRSPELKLY